MKLKKILVAALAVTMIMGSSSMAFAAEQKGQGEGSGDLDVVKDTDVFSVVVPTDAGTTFDYIVDPLGVIQSTNAEKYGNKSFDHSSGATVFFQNTDVTSAEAPYNYTGTSNKLKAINKSTKKVSIKVDATLTDTDEVTMTEAGAATGDTDVLLNLQLNGDSSKTAAIKDGAAASIDAEINETAGAYETKYVNGEYVQQLKSTYKDEDFNAYEFWLTGEANPSSDWRSVEKVPQVKLVWTVTGDGKNVTGPQITLSKTGLVTISGLTAELDLSSDPETQFLFSIRGDDANQNRKLNQAYCDIARSADRSTVTIQLKGAYSICNGKTVDVVAKLTDGSTISTSNTIDADGIK